MVFKKIDLFKLRPFFWGPRMGTMRGDAQCWVLGWDEDSLQQRVSLFHVFLLGQVVQSFLFLRAHLGHAAYRPVAVGMFIIIPGHKLCKVVIEGNASSASIVKEWASLLKSQETIWSSVQPGVPFSGASP